MDTVCDRKRLNSATLVPDAIHKSAFLRDCFFLDGFEMTLILRDWKTPMSAPEPQNIFTESLKCLRLSLSLINKVLAAQ